MKLIKNAQNFLFIGPISLSNKVPEAEIDLTTTDDRIKCVIINNMSYGKITSDVTLEEVVKSLSDEELKKGFANRFNITLDTSTEETTNSDDTTTDTTETDDASSTVDETSTDTTSDSTDIDESSSEDSSTTESTTTDEDADSDESTEESEETTSDTLVSDSDVLSGYLNGSIKSIRHNIYEAKLSNEDLQKLIDLETAGKNRIALVTYLQECLG